jgi:hypothetical protein
MRCRVETEASVIEEVGDRDPKAADTRLPSTRMSLEHLKVMAFMLRRQLLQFEQGTGVRVEVPQEVLNQLRIGREDWDRHWG